MPLPILLLNCFRIDSSMTPPPDLNIFHCYPHQPPLPLPPPPIKFLLYIRHPQKDHEAPCPAAQHHPTQPFTTPVTICFIASVWIREKYENFILSSYWKRGKYKILYFPRFQYEESMSFFKMSGSRSIFKASTVKTRI